MARPLMVPPISLNLQMTILILSIRPPIFGCNNRWAEFHVYTQIWIIYKRVGVILRVQGAKDSRIQVKYLIFSMCFKFNPSSLPCVYRWVYSQNHPEKTVNAEGYSDPYDTGSVRSCLISDSPVLNNGSNPLSFEY